MKSNHLVFLVVGLLAAKLVFGGAPTTSADRPLSEFGPPIRITSSVLTFQQGVETRHPSRARKYLANGEWDKDENVESSITSGSRDGYLRFVGVVGTGHVYVPDDSADRSRNSNYDRQW